ncbi:zinc ribbon domain-containing protein [Catenovulum sp. SM1970]|uniref:zinc-ribbon domain-containing protein n=1 Tax=Marinifaba aquimaris TaxID=2741323 RepID=UPI0015721FEC|nr:zinc ribbon domain-containing protein [Marinifaba aquimaris]NTS78541.1 zinc ribbon domain-containing protein [Marinifaba aquimaris]
MALISCPKCGKRVSDKADSCLHCGAVLVDDPEKLQRLGRIERIKRSSQLMTRSFLALILFIGGLAYSGFYADKGESTDKWISQIVAGIGFVWYLILRVQIIQFKREGKS